MLDTLTREAFTPLVGSRVSLTRCDDDPLELTLDEAAPGGPEASRAAARDGRREPFTLLFTGPPEPVLPQRTYPVEVPGLGRLDLFLVPVGPAPRGMRYEAVFT